ncbi:MAG: hypothetical protein IPM34_13055 [Saprospiraceae bacterium]|nr:hypothetical protein [Saprospiraceae bacterium]
MNLLNTHSEKKADYVNRLYNLTDRGARANDQRPISLYDILWKPMEHHLQDIKKIYYSPVGLLHRINMDALPITDQESLGDRFDLIRLNSSRQLVFPIRKRGKSNGSIVWRNSLRSRYVFNRLETKSGFEIETRYQHKPKDFIRKFLELFTRKRTRSHGN